jgi:hypothetical protein
MGSTLSLSFGPFLLDCFLGRLLVGRHWLMSGVD